MDRLYVKTAGIYLAFRMQLAVKVLVLSLIFGAAIPLVYPLGVIFFQVPFPSLTSPHLTPPRPAPPATLLDLMFIFGLA